MALLLLAQEWAAAAAGSNHRAYRRSRACARNPPARRSKSAHGRGLAGSHIERCVGPARSRPATSKPRRVPPVTACWRNGARRPAFFILLLAHHRDDQAETFLLRLARGSGLDGLAAMAAVVERPGCRLLRPLLAVPRASLVATLAAHDQAWLDDPSNRNDKFARVRLRRGHAILAREGLSAARLAATAGRLARARQALELPLARLLRRHRRSRSRGVHPVRCRRLWRRHLRSSDCARWARC